MTDDVGERWFVRFAGKRSGPFGIDRLRTMAERGQLTAVHFLSRDGEHWVPADRVPSVFRADGKAIGTDAPSSAADAGTPLWEIDLLADGEVTEPPVSAGPPAAEPPPKAPLPSRAGGARGLVGARPVAVAGLALAAVALVVSALVSMPGAGVGDAPPFDGTGVTLTVRLLQLLGLLAAAALLVRAPSNAVTWPLAVTGATMSVASSVEAFGIPAAAIALPAVPAAAALHASIDAEPAVRHPIRALGVAAGVVGALAVALLCGSGRSGPMPVALASLASAGCAALAFGALAGLSGDAVRRRRHGAVAIAGGSAVALALLGSGIVNHGERGSIECAADACLALGFAGVLWVALRDAVALQASNPG